MSVRNLIRGSSAAEHLLTRVYYSRHRKIPSARPNLFLATAEGIFCDGLADAEALSS